ncbi:MAG TPA: P27 family phage terminase small subunit [Xanthobacteraceae bacterium]|jgi:P27 family predicted phage terminase small subunit
MAEKDPITSGLVVKKNGNATPNPLVAIAEKAARAMVRYAAEFGLTPAARSRISATDVSAADSKFGPLLWLSVRRKGSAAPRRSSISSRS